MPSPSIITVALTIALPVLANALNTTCSPGGNFDLTPWALQLPTGQHNLPDEIPSAELQSCTHGYTSSDYFFTSPTTGALVMKCPGSSNCTLPNCSTELIEVKPDSWPTSGRRNRLRMTLEGIRGDRICVGQVVQADDGTSRPVASVYYLSSGDLKVGVGTGGSGGQEVYYDLGNVGVGKRFTYELRYEMGRLGVAVDGGEVTDLGLGVEAERAFFKAGDGNLGSGEGEIHVFELVVSH